jgi:dethiobiotin synthetase
MQLFITAIGTDSGKTIVSSIFTECFEADYWKPIQSGLPRDTERVQELITNKRTVFHPEGFLLQNPVSPHAAARMDSVSLSVAAIELPVTDNHLIIEGAGGVLAPLNEREFVCDMPAIWKIPVVLVANLYLGSINHTLLTFNELQRRNIRIIGIIFNGNPNADSESIILHHTGLRVLLRIPQLPVVSKEVIKYWANKLKTEGIGAGIL